MVKTNTTFKVTVIDKKAAVTIANVTNSSSSSGSTSSAGSGTNSTNNSTIDAINGMEVLLLAYPTGQVTLSFSKAVQNLTSTIKDLTKYLTLSLQSDDETSPFQYRVQRQNNKTWTLFL